MPSVFDNLAGAGDASELLERFKDQLQDSFFELGTTNIFLLDDNDSVDGSSTATFSNNDDTFDFSSPGEFVLSTASLDPEFLSVALDIDQIELVAWWGATGIDDSAIYEVSRDGGNEFQAVDMSRIGTTTDTFRGVHIFSEEASNQTLDEYPLSNDDSDLPLNITTIKNRGQVFTLSTTSVIKEMTVYLNKLGTPAGNLKVKVIKDDSGFPSTSDTDVVVSSDNINIPGLSSGDNDVVLDIADSTLAAGDYHIVFVPDSDYEASFSSSVDEIRVRGDSSSPTIPDSAIFDGATWSAATGIALVYKLEGRVLDLRIKITSSTGNVSLRGYGFLYSTSTLTQNGILEREVFSFAGSSNTSSFTLTKFLPNPSLLRVFEPKTGQVYKFPAFTLDGQTIKFPAGTFDKPGETIVLDFDQTVGGAFDNSDINALILAANFLGSTDATVDLSVAGRGIRLRNKSGELREIILNEDDDFEILSTS